MDLDTKELLATTQQFAGPKQQEYIGTIKYAHQYQPDHQFL